MKNTFFCFLLCLLGVGFSSCASDFDIGDEFEEETFKDRAPNYNKKIYNFNIAFYKTIEPQMNFYSSLPIELRWTIKTLSSHYNEQVLFGLYNLLDFDLEGFLLSFWKISINTIFGFGGIYDVADKLEVPLAEKSFEDIFYKFNIYNISHLQVPISGGGDIFKGAAAIIDNSYRIFFVFPAILHLLNMPNLIKEDMDFVKMSGNYSSYNLYKTIFWLKYKNTRIRNMKNRNSRLLNKNPCDNKHSLEFCDFESTDLE